ncbi:TPA: hypothetical protein KPK48_003301 [Clostridioides difficile]|nr:hypothetical protein [Clostridioides difficile]
MKRKILLQELQNSSELRKSYCSTSNKKTNRKEKGDLKSRFFSGKIKKNEKKMIDCFV